MSEPAGLAILVPAAGRGARAGAAIPKQYKKLAGRPLLARTIEALMRAAPGAAILPVIQEEDRPLYQACAADIGANPRPLLMEPVPGGATRQASVHNGLEALAKLPIPPAMVLIHDAARPFVSPGLVARAFDAATNFGAAAPGLAPSDTIKQIDAAGWISATLPRAQLRAIQTPQAFAFGLILGAHRRAASAGEEDCTDDAAVAERAGHRIHVFEGEAGNMKITTAEDFARAEAQLLGALNDIRIGQGYDVHAFGDGSHICLGGVKIAHGRGLVGHSDADVLIHAIADALFGALADGDIGSHFPPSDPKWRGAASRMFLAAAAEEVRARGGIIAHIDATIVCERPKIGPRRDEIRASIAAIAGICAGRVALKATTSERLGFTGREEGVAALAVATIRLPL